MTITRRWCVHHLFEAQADGRASQPAIVSGDVVLTYAEVEARANQLARYLRSRGVGTGQMVGLGVAPSADAVVAILSILKAGAAYVPMDLSQSPERTRHILAETGIELLVIDTERQAVARQLGAATVAIDDGAAPWQEHSTARLSAAETGLSSDHLGYVLYTSGSSGRPKGVMTEHGNVVSFVRAFNEVIGLTGEDRVLQGFALGFDGSVEEMWMAFSNGATLLVPPRGAPRFGDDLARFMTENGVTVFSTVPTSLAMISDPLPTVRLLIVSGEVCPPEAVNRWAKPPRRMLNVYGPTETTVNATAAECHPGQVVTIGTPLPGYTARIVDDAGHAVAPGETGELLIAGPGVARGYLGRPDLTREHFLTLPGRIPGDAERAYRTGDLVSLGEGGQLLFHGRIDHQIKLRGFRIELPEIEAVLAEHASIRAAVVNLVGRDGASELAAHVVAADPAVGVDRNSVLALLGSRLPSYMVPPFLDVLEALPTLPSGKVDRNSLPSPVARLVRGARTRRAPQTDAEARILGVMSQVVGNDAISTDDDFFLALGGYSLLAAQLVSELRARFGSDVAIRDVYDYPTVAGLAARLTTREAAARAAPARPPLGTPAQTASHLLFPPAVAGRARALCASLQALSLLVLYGVMASPLLGGLIPFFAWRRGHLSLPAFLGVSLLILACSWPFVLVLSVVVKWTVIGRYKRGVHPLWGWYYFRCWLVRRFEQIALPGVMAGTPLMSLYYRAMGARVGRGCTIDTAHCAIFDLVTIGDDTSIGSETQLLGYRVEDGQLLVGAIDIGSRCFVGTHSALGLDTRMADDSRLGDLSFLPDRESTGRGESRRGSPARPCAVPVPEPVPGAPPASRRPVLFGLLHLAMLYGVGLALLPTTIPSGLLMSLAAASGRTLWMVLSVPAAGVTGFVAFCLWVPVLKHLILARVRPGVYEIESAFYLRKWAIDLLLAASRTLARPLYTTIFLPAWLRLLGAKIGRRAEIATVSQLSPELTDIGEQSFFADGSMIGGRRIHRGLLQLAESRVGRRSFVGNSAILPVGTSLGAGCLLGCLSAPPDGHELVPDGTEWLGSPSFSLPHRRKIDGFDESVTHEPTRRLIAGRLAVDALRIAIPATLMVTELSILQIIGAWAWGRLSPAAWLLVMPAAAAATAAVGLLAVAATKRILIGRFRPVVKPLWSAFVWLNEAVNGAYESIAVPLMVPLLGTPYCAPWLRLLGCKIGRGVYLETTMFSEFDLVEVGDGASLNAGAVIQNHLFEDRVMKVSALRIGDRCSVGNMAVVLYDSEMQTGSSIGPLSLLMKGETLPPHTRWLGIPTAYVSGQTAPLSPVAPAEKPTGFTRRDRRRGERRRPARNLPGSASPADGG